MDDLEYRLAALGQENARLRRDLEASNKRMEQMRQQHRSMLDQSPVGIVIHHLGEIEYANTAVSEIAGYTLEEAIGRNMLEFIAPEDRNFVMKMAQDRLDGKDVPAGYELRLIHKDGRIIDAELSAAIYREDGLAKTLAFIRDISDRKKALKQLAESEEKFRTISEQSLLGIAIISQDGFKYANDAYVALTGYTKEEIMAMSVADTAKMTHPRYRDFVIEQGRKKMAGISEGVIPRYEYIGIRKDGAERWVAQYSKTITWQGRPADLITIIDITQRKELEEQLLIRQKMDSLGTLAGGIAHDFNNILAGVIGYIDMLGFDHDNLTEAQKECIENALQATQRAVSLTRKLQTITRSDQSQKTGFDLYHVAKEVFGILGETTDRMIAKYLDMPEGEHIIHGNASELSQVFMNLGLNAVQAIEEKGASQGGMLRLSALKHDSDGLCGELQQGKYVHLMFEDTGIGMSQETKMQIFDPLFTTKSRGTYKGQGLGMTMVYNIVKHHHNGDITVESEPGRGTIIHLYLPVGKLENCMKPAVSMDLQGSGTILVIDDERPICDLAANILRRYGYNVETASDGAEGLKMFMGKPAEYRAVICDMMMPKMSGNQVLEAILAFDPEKKVILSSGMFSESPSDGKAAGYLSKPYSMKDLPRKLKEIIG